MIDHTGIGVADMLRSAAFYDAALGALGYRRVIEMPGNDGIGYGFEHPIFWIDRFHPHGTRQHTAFAARSCAEVDAFHAAALQAGGSDNGPPGDRESSGYPAGYYAAFVLDPDGNNMEAVFRGGSRQNEPGRSAKPVAP
jgi:catechol 2,3-dioxygenase-like lactoylglutathione lyase family enzyme